MQTVRKKAPSIWPSGSARTIRENKRGMEEKNGNSMQPRELDAFSLVRDLIRNLWAILIGALAVAMLVNVYYSFTYERTYTTTATFVVTSKSSGNYVYKNLSSAQTMADTLSNILNSSVLKTEVCRDLGVSELNAQCSASVIDETNLLNLSVTADSPQNAYKIIRSIMKTYSSLAGYVSADIVMTVLKQPAIPTGADSRSSAMAQAKKWFVYSFLLFAVLFGILSCYHDTIKSEKAMTEKLDAKTLGTIYHERRYKTLLSALKKHRSGILISDVTTSFEYVERFKKITARILTQGRTKVKNPKVILVTSASDGEGRTTVASNIAITLAHQSGHVLLIDGDMRKPEVAKLFGTKCAAGCSIADLAKGNATIDEALLPSGTDGLWLIAGGRPNRNSTDLIASQEMKNVMKQLRQRMDYIVIDTPSMMAAPDAEAFGELADISVLVVKYDDMLAEDLNDAIDSLKDTNAKLAGCILNDVLLRRRQLLQRWRLTR
jgi:capsular exopolysaccharide synthesis family protein